MAIPHEKGTPGGLIAAPQTPARIFKPENAGVLRLGMKRYLCLASKVLLTSFQKSLWGAFCEGSPLPRGRFRFNDRCASLIRQYSRGRR